MNAAMIAAKNAAVHAAVKAALLDAYAAMGAACCVFRAVQARELSRVQLQETSRDRGGRYHREREVLHG